MIEKHFQEWDYYAVQELEQLCYTLPVLPREKANAFFKEARRVTGGGNKEVERHTGKIFESMMGFVSASDRKDFSATSEVGSQSLADGVLMVETYDRVIGVIFCVARISEDSFLTLGWTGEEAKESIKGLRAKAQSPINKKWWQFWR